MPSKKFECSEDWPDCLRRAATRGEDGLRQRLAEGVDVNVKDALGRTALMRATTRGCFPGPIKVLLDNGADANARDSGGATALMIAMQRCGLESISLLVQGGSEINARYQNGSTALLCAVGGWLAPWTDPSTGWSGLAKRPTMELEYGPIPSHLRLQLQKELLREEEVVRFLLGAGADVNSGNKHNDTALALACLQGRRGTASLLLEKGARVNVRGLGGRTPLMNAARQGDPKLVRLLLEKGADVKARDDAGRTALMEAADKRRPPRYEMVGTFAFAPRAEVVRILLEHGADLDERSNDGETALQIAKDNGLNEVVQLLKERGARE